MTWLGTAVSHAQPKAGDWEFTLGGAGTSDRRFDSGAFTLGGSVGYFLNDNFEVGVRQNIGFTSGADDWNGDTLIAADWHFHLGKLVPFIGAVTGYIYGDRINETWAIGPEAGVKFYVHQQTFIFVKGDYVWLFDDGDDIDDRFDDGRFAFTVGVGFNF